MASKNHNYISAITQEGSNKCPSVYTPMQVKLQVNTITTYQPSCKRVRISVRVISAIMQGGPNKCPSVRTPMPKKWQRNTIITYLPSCNMVRISVLLFKPKCMRSGKQTPQLHICHSRAIGFEHSDTYSVSLA